MSALARGGSFTLRAFIRVVASAILIDRTRNNVLHAPLDECRALAAQHRYELVIPRHLGETLLSRVERFQNRPS